MDRIALFLGETVIYWRSLLLTGAALVAILVFLALYLRRKGNALSAAVVIPLALCLSLVLARYQHWYCRPAAYAGFLSAMTNYSSGEFALMGAFAGCALAALLLRLLRISKDLPHMLDCMSLAGAAAIPIGRLACLYNSADRGPLLTNPEGQLWASQVVNTVSGATEYRLATFAIQALVTAGIFLVLLIFWAVGTRKKTLPGGDTTLLFLLLYGSSQVVLDSTRYDALAFRSNGFVGIVQVLGALGIGLAWVVFSVRLVRRRGMKLRWIALWLVIAALLGIAGYMEYHVQRHAAEAVFAYTVMSLCLIGAIGLIIFLRSRAMGGACDPFAGATASIFAGNRRAFRVTVAALCAVAVCLLGSRLFLSRYIWTGGGFVSRESQQLDLQDVDLSYEDYLHLQEELPNCHIVWSILFQGQKYASDTRTLTVTTLTEEDLEILGRFSGLESLDASGCRDYAPLLAFHTQFPQCRLTYQVTLGGQEYGNDTTSLRLTDADPAELKEVLPWLPKLESLVLTGKLPAMDQLQDLQNTFPDLAVGWETVLGDIIADNGIQTLDLSAKELSFTQLKEGLPYLTALKELNLLDTNLTQQQIMELVREYPGCFVLAQLDVAGASFRTDAVEIDISGRAVSAPEEVENLLPFFPKLEKVIMSRCGLDNETMDALNKRHDSIRFVWSIVIQDRFYVRTDTTYFYPYKLEPNLPIDNDDVYNLRYCPDIVVIDIGHCGSVTNCEFVRFMPNLQYFIIGETSIRDLSPLETCKNLIYLEMFTIPAMDYTPLEGCTALQDLCIGDCFGDPAPIARMTWLKNVWWSGVHGTVGHPASNAKAVLEAALPNTTLKFEIAHATAGGWRRLPNYYKMRDLMGMFYLP